MLREIRPAILMVILFTVLLGLVYPLGMTGISQVLFPWQANGSLLTRNGQVIRMSCTFSPLDGMSIGMSLVQARRRGELPISGGVHRMVSHLYF